MSFNFQIARSGSSGFVCVWPSDLALGTYWRVMQMATRHTYSRLLFAASRVSKATLSASSLTYCLSPALRPNIRNPPRRIPPAAPERENYLELTFSQRCSLHGDHA